MEKEDPVKVGTHSPSLSQPLIQMGMSLHPSDIDQRARVADVAVAISSLQVETAMTRMELATFRIAMIVQSERIQEFVVAEMARCLDRVEHRLSDLSQIEVQRLRELSRLEDRFNQLMSSAYEHMDKQNNAVAELREKVAALPETYLWTRFVRALQRALRRIFKRTDT